MPLLGSFGAAGSRSFGLTAGASGPTEIEFLVVAGGGGGGQPQTSSSRGFGAGHGGAAGNPSHSANAIAGSDNTGGGGGGGGVPNVNPIVSPAANGGSGIVFIRTPGDVNLGVSPGTNSVATLPSGEKVATFTVSGNLTT